MLIVVDEASGVSDPIMEAILGTLSGFDNKLLMCGNPNNIEGVFYDSHNSDRDKYRVHKVSSYDSKRTNKDNIEMILKNMEKKVMLLVSVFLENFRKVRWIHLSVLKQLNWLQKNKLVIL